MSTALAVTALAAEATKDTGTGEEVLFWILAPIMVIASLGLMFARKAVHAALSMALVMTCLGIVYLAQQAPFLGAVQVFVYTGAVMMIFLFVVMLIGVDSSDSLVETIKGQRVAGVLLGLGLVALLVGVLGHVTFPPAQGLADVAQDGNITGLAYKIFGADVWAFEVTSALLITAALGAMVLAHRERLVPRPTQRELSERRIREGAVKAPLPAPGVFARHNAVDTPALLPDGSTSELSVSRVLAARGQERSTSENLAAAAARQAEIDHPLVDRPVLASGEDLAGVSHGVSTEVTGGASTDVPLTEAAPPTAEGGAAVAADEGATQ